jgi:hypothetical protein
MEAVDKAAPPGKGRFLDFRLGGVLRDLMLILVEVKRGIKLGLLGKEVTKPLLMLKCLIELGGAIGKGLFLALGLRPFLLGQSVKRTQRMFDALDGADRVFRIKVCAVGFFASHEKLRQFRFAVQAFEDSATA